MIRILLASLLLWTTEDVTKIKFDLVIEDIKLFDGEKVFESATVGVKDGMITVIDTLQERKYRSKVKINGFGKTLVPGLINSHVHAFEKAHLRQAAKNGVLTLIDLFNTPSVALHLKQYSDSTNYPYYYSSGFVVTAPGGHCTQYGFSVPTIDDVNKVPEFVNNRLHEGSDFIKIIVEPGTETNSIPSLSEHLLKKTIEYCNEKGILTVVHVSYKSDALKAAQFGATGLAHIWKRGSSTLSNEELDLIVGSKTFIIPTLLVRKKILEDNPSGIEVSLDELQDEVLKLHRAAVPILAGTDPPNYNLDFGQDLINELSLLVEAGLTELEALKAATSIPSVQFRLRERGFIKSGYSADFIMINGDPTVNIQNLRSIEGVWKRGKLVSLD